MRTRQARDGAGSGAASGPARACADLGRFPLVDGARAVAALSVLVFHVGVLGGLSPGSALHPYNDLLSGGVTLFFVISGFVLYRPFVSARRAGRAVDLRTYARRRLLRILPGYWVALTLLTVVFGLPGVFTSDWWRYYGLLQIYDLRTYDLGMGVAWTLCIEASFYALLPAYAALAGRWLRDRQDPLRRELVLLAAVAAGAVAFCAWVHLTGRDERITRTLPGTLDWFAVGMAFAVVSVHRPDLRLRRPGRLWGAATLVLLALGLLGGPQDDPAWYQLLRQVLVGAAAALLLAPAVFPRPPDGSSGLVRRLLGAAWLRWLGLVSYGLYLYHATLIPPQLSRGLPARLPGSDYGWLLLTTCVLATAAATASWYLVERPASRLRPLRRRRASTPPPVPDQRSSTRVGGEVETSAATPSLSSSARTSDT